MALLPFSQPWLSVWNNPVKKVIKNHSRKLINMPIGTQFISVMSNWVNLELIQLRNCCSLKWRLFMLPSQLLQCLFALFRVASPAAINRGWYWVCRVQLNSIAWVVGQVTEHRPKLWHSPLIKAERNTVSECISHSICFFVLMGKQQQLRNNIGHESYSLAIGHFREQHVVSGGDVNRKWVTYDLLLSGLSSVGHRLNHHYVASFSDR